MSINVTFLDVGNGDCIIISQSNTSAVVVDVRSTRRLEKWLEDHEIKLIDCLYITHEHQDHFPSLTDFVTFIENWLKKDGTQVKRLCLPTEIIRNPNALINNTNMDDAQKKRLQSALDKLDLWETRKILEILRGERGSSPHTYGDIHIDILHPFFSGFERQNAKRPNSLNETSVVLRIDYGAFRALLLADLENSGISVLLERYTDSDLRSQLVKIPHHGAWPSNSDEFSQLLRIIDPELAILSVGSKNQHGHVVPELFKELLELKNGPSYRLDQFVCTEVTCTCIWDSIKRKANRHANLEQAMPCAGDISIIAESTGTWTREDTSRHAEIVKTIGFAACQGKLDIRQ